MPDHTLKLVLVGEPGVGKTSLLMRYVHNIFSPYTQNTLGARSRLRTGWCEPLRKARARRHEF